MRIVVNGAWRELRAPQLAAALAELGYEQRVVGTALNGEFVPVGARATTPLQEGDRLEVLAPVQGG
ncbi:MAG: sulfur carrier protein ThiS [Gammaproteobacteria bacterium]|nr:sulfur carrier protein ThiS [Gammaproteobacteria bacterium]MBV9622132.1 sulfur carrier protein ThiS [Gammaproteobacteria bacterium]